MRYSFHKTNSAAGLRLLLAATTGVFVTAFAGLSPVSAIAAPPSSSAAPVAVLSRVRMLENRFFFHTYEQDPVEKRLQRLELLVFGQTKDGNDQERLQYLNTTIAERDRESALKMQRQHQIAPAAPASPESATAPANKAAGGHYPAVTALEWRVLKKTYPAEVLDDRLGRLETKLFGQPSPSMSYADRVERLNRTLGIGAVASASPSRSRGPMPKTGSQSDGQPNFSYDFRSTPFGTEMNPAMPFFGNESFGFFGFSDPQVSELFKQMNEQMEEMMRMTPELFPIPQEEPATPSKKKKPKLSPGWKIPGNSIRQTPVLAPYNDPNSI